MSERKLKITLVGSLIGHTERQRATVRSLGLHRLNSSAVHADRPEIRGMANAVHHLVRVDEFEAAEETAAPAEAAPAAPATEGAEE